MDRFALAVAITLAVETAILFALLSRRHPTRDRLAAGLWLSTCTLPVVWFVFPLVIEDRTTYLVVAETFAALAECGLFRAGFARGRSTPWRDYAAVVTANIASFGLGEMVIC